MFAHYKGQLIHPPATTLTSPSLEYADLSDAPVSPPALPRTSYNFAKQKMTRQKNHGSTGFSRALDWRERVLYKYVFSRKCKTSFLCQPQQGNVCSNRLRVRHIQKGLCLTMSPQVTICILLSQTTELNRNTIETHTPRPFVRLGSPFNTTTITRTTERCLCPELLSVVLHLCAETKWSAVWCFAAVVFLLQAAVPMNWQGISTGEHSQPSTWLDDYTLM